MRTRVWANTTQALRFAALCMAILFGLASILATGGGGGGGGGSSSSAGSGTVAVLVGDGPAEDYDHIYVYVTKVSLIPAFGTSPGPVVIFESSSPAGHKIDLLAYRDEDSLLGIKHNVPAGRYEKIRLEVATIEAEGGPCELELIKLPSGKIDLKRHRLARSERAAEDAVFTRRGQGGGHRRHGGLRQEGAPRQPAPTA